MNVKPRRNDPMQRTQPPPAEMNTLMTLFNTGRHAEVESRARSLLEHYPDAGHVWKLLGGALQMQGKNALLAFRKASELMPGEADAHYNLGVAQKSFGLVSDAVASYRRALQINPEYAEAYYNLGNVVTELGQLDEAVTIYHQALQVKPDFADVHIKLGNVLKDLGQLDEAMTCYRRALALKPDYADAHYNLGNALKDLGQLDEAAACYRRALEVKPDFADAYNNLGIALKELGQPDAALSCCRRSLELRPDFADAHNNLGTLLRELGRIDAAVVSYRKAVELKPDFADAHENLGNALQEFGQHDEARASFRRAAQLRHNLAEAYNKLGSTLLEREQLDGALANFLRAVHLKPDFARAHNNLGVVLQNLNKFDDAIASYRRALKLNPDSAEAHYNLASVLKSQGNLSDARAYFRKAQELGHHGARVSETLMLPPIMGTLQEVMESRAEFEHNLDKLITGEVTTIDYPLKEVRDTNFYLAFHGLNDRDSQVKVAKFYEQACPSLLYTAPHCDKPRSDKKIRVGFLSRHLYSHSVSFCFSKIIESLSIKEPFEAALISNLPIDMKVYSEFTGKCVRLPFNLTLAREMISALELDILVYLDIGMEPLSYFLAFSRLARVQCVLAGHPVTTGITNMDYFLSSDLIEPADADEHYSEKLVRFPTPPVYFARPTMPARLKTRTELGLPEDRHIYMCPMKLQKLHPDFDEAITRILQLDDNGVVVLFEDNQFPSWKTAMIKRFERTIPSEAQKRILFLPWLKDSTDFISAIATADVVLDPFHFGIGSTAIKTFVTCTPMVTKTGEYMRGRVGTFYCKFLDLSECIAEDSEGYAVKAVLIATNPTLRNTICAKILKNSRALYDNLQPVDDLAEFFRSLVNQGRRM